MLFWKIKVSIFLPGGYFYAILSSRRCSLMDKAHASEAWDCGFDPRHCHYKFTTPQRSAPTLGSPPRYVHRASGQNLRGVGRVYPRFHQR